MTFQSPTGEADVLLEYHPSPVSLVVFGGGPDAVPLVRLAKTLGWQVTVVDARVAAASRVRFPEADTVIVCGPEEVRLHVPLTSHSIAVVMTHNYRRDLTLLQMLLPSPVRYLGLLGARARAERLLRDLSRTGLVASPEQLRRIHAPAGLDLGAEGPEEIALAIVAEIKATLACRPAGPLRERSGPIHEREELEGGIEYIPYCSVPGGDVVGAARRHLHRWPGTGAARSTGGRWPRRRSRSRPW
jgi:xanthine/CO dehydrogenase XdhC/CoxF family maturation factor